jgi:transcriptional regulator with XRE-family HTH domain
MGNSLISNILKTLMFKKNMNTSQLARDTNLPQQTLNRIVSGNSPNPHAKTLKAIANFFDISIEQLKGKQPLPESKLTLDLPAINKPKAKQIPLIKWDDLPIFIEKSKSYIINQFIYGSSQLGENVFSLTMNDSSMEPYFPEGAVLIFDPNKMPKDRSHVLTYIAESDTYLFRQLLIDGEYHYLKPLNPDLTTFQMRLLNEHDKILSVLVEFRHTYDN